MKEQIVDEEIRLIPYYRNDEASLPWYQDADVCKQVDDRDTPYDLELLHRMYDYLCTHGDCYYIEYCGTLVGDISLRDSGELAVLFSCRRHLLRFGGHDAVQLGVLREVVNEGQDRVAVEQQPLALAGVGHIRKLMR